MPSLYKLNCERDYSIDAFPTINGTDSFLVPLWGTGYTFRGGNSVQIILPYSGKGDYSKRIEFAHLGSKFFPFRVDSFFKMGLLCSNANRKSEKLSPLYIKVLQALHHPHHCTYIMQLP